MNQQPGLRPLGFGEILDGAFVLYRRNFAAFLAISALSLAPSVALQLALAAAGTPVGNLDLATLALSLLLYLLGSAALIRAAADAYRGRGVDVRVAFARARARYWTLLRAVAVAWAMVAVGFLLLVVPGVVASVRFFAVEQAAVLEDTTPSEARSRSEFLSAGAGAQIFWMMLVLTVISTLPLTSQELLRTVAGNDGIVSNPFLAGAISDALLILTLPLTSAAYTLLYFDRRVRSEALDVEVAMRRMQPAV